MACVLYRGDSVIGVYESFYAVACAIGCKVESARFYSSPTHKKRSGRSKDAYIVEVVNDAD